jgi:hypothetical protein
MNIRPKGEVCILQECSETDDLSLYSKQYSHIYFCRLKQSLSALQKAAKVRWTEPNDNANNYRGIFFAPRILELPSDCETVLFGVIYIDSPLKPCILQDLEHDVCFVVFLILTLFIS